MKYGVIIIEQKEHDLLKKIISMAKYYKDENYKRSIEKLHVELQTAKIVPNSEMPVDVVRFNSTVRIKTAFNVSRDYMLVTPEKSDIKQNKISILAPMGLALFGYAAGDEITWHFPSGESQILIEDVQQLDENLKYEARI